MDRRKALAAFSEEDLLAQQVACMFIACSCGHYVFTTELSVRLDAAHASRLLPALLPAAPLPTRPTRQLLSERVSSIQYFAPQSNGHVVDPQEEFMRERKYLSEPATKVTRIQKKPSAPDAHQKQPEAQPVPAPPTKPAIASGQSVFFTQFVFSVLVLFVQTALI